MKIIYSIVLGLFLVTPVFAEEALTIPQKRDEIKQKIEEKKFELQDEIKEKQVEIKNKIASSSEEQKIKLQIFAQERVLNILVQIFEQFEAVLVKFDGIVIRIDARITKLDESNFDTTEQKELLKIAKQNIQDSTALVAATKLELQSLVTDEISKNQIKSSIQACKDSLKKSHQSLVDVVESLKKYPQDEQNPITIE